MAIGTNIPAKLIKQLIPVLMKQVDTLSTEAEKFINEVSQLSPNLDCNDPAVKSAKLKLQQLYSLIDNIKNGLNLINRITPVITTISTVATVLSTVQLAIPSVPGVPSGPIAKLITTFDNLGKINISFARINQLLAKAISKLSAICNTETFNVSAEINDAIDDLNLFNDDLNVPTQFYTELNVSDFDINSRLLLIESLVDQQVNVLTNLKEAPSKVIAGTATPTISAGDIDDYYIDTDTDIIYGPKTQLGWGTGINI
jgi:hypothetical protein